MNSPWSSVVASSSYITGEKRIDERTGEIHDYTRKGGVVHSEVLLSKNAPPEYANGKNLWNAVSKVEGQNGRTAKSPEMSLPKELNKEEQIKLAREAVQEFYVKDGRCAEFAIHDKGDGNPHVHALVTTRPIDKNGQWEYKTEKVYICKSNAGEEMEFNAYEFKQVKDDGWEKQKPYYKDGNPKKRPVYLTDYEKEHNYKWKDYQRVKGKNDPLKTKEDRNNPLCDKWNSPENHTEWREFWARKVNRELEKKNILDRVDHRSLKDQGIQRKPQIHIGPHATALEKKYKDFKSDRGEQNRKIIDFNEAQERLRNDVKELNTDIEKYNAEVIQFKAQKEQPPKQSAASISEPRPPIAQPAQLSAKLEQPRSFQERQTDFEQAKTNIEGHKEAIEEIKAQLNLENYKLQKYKYSDKEIGQVDKEIREAEESLGKLSRFNPKKWKERKDLGHSIEALEQSKGNLVSNKQADFGETRREHIEQRITQLDEEKQLEKNRLPELNTRYEQTRDAFYQHIAQLNEHDQRSGTPISEPTRPPIVQQPQPILLEPVQNKVSNERSTLSIDEWKKQISQAGNTKKQIIKMYSEEFPSIRHITERTAQSINALNTEYGQTLSIKTIKKVYSLAGKNFDADPTDANRAMFDKFENVLGGVKQAQMTEKREQVKENVMNNPSKFKSKNMQIGDDR